MSSRLIPRENLTDWARFEMGTLARPAAAAGGPEAARDRAAAEAQGREAGYQAGLAEGRADAARLAALAASLDARLAALDDSHAAHLADLALEIARQVLRGEPRLVRASIAAVAREALACLPEGLRRPHLVLHPADAALVRARLGDALDRGAWTVIEDHRIAPGGCRLETEHGQIDATVATRWRQAAAALGRDCGWDDE